MATPSTMLELGIRAPNFELPDMGSDARMLSLEDLSKADALLVVFICNHCPFVVHVRGALASFAREYAAKSLAMVGINSNDVEQYPADSPEMMTREIEIAGYTFPYLFDESQDVARAYDAACTPDFFLFDKSRRLVYRGQFDDSRPGNGIPVTGRDLRKAADAVLAGETVSKDQKPSIGCSIKWK